MSKPSFLFVSSCYPASLEYFKIENKENKTYKECKEGLSQKLFDASYRYSLNLNKLGYKTDTIIFNHEILQRKWAEENEVEFSRFSPPHLARKSYLLRAVISRFPRIYYPFKNLIERNTWKWKINMAQIKKFRPDILFIFDLHYFTPAFLKEARKYVGKIVGEITSPIMMPEEYFKSYDLLFSSLPHYVRKFQEMGIPAGYLPYAFESTILDKIGAWDKQYDCVFIGVISRELDRYRHPLLEKLAQRVNIDFWGHLQPPVTKSSPILSKYHGQAWGIDMFKIYAQSKIAVNYHTKKVGKSFAWNEKYASNLRLYEATGMGAMLITDAKENLGELFEVGKEVETYSSLEELVEKIKYYLAHDKEREKIALAGQKRTLRDHTCELRAKKLLEIIFGTIL